MFYIFAIISILIGMIYCALLVAYGNAEYLGVRNLPWESIVDALLFFIILSSGGFLFYKSGKCLK